MGQQLIMSLRSEIEQELEKQKITFHELAKATGINRGILSACFTRIPPKTLSIRQLDIINKGLDKQEGWLYDLYMDECFSEKVHWKQLKPFLLRCLDLNKYDLIETALARSMESLNHIQDVFSLAESLYSEGKWKEALPFYRCVCENEIKQHSIRMAVSQYRWFRTRIGNDLNENRAAVLQFSAFRQRLPENFQLDALLQLANVHFNLGNWEEVISYASELQTLTDIILQHKTIRNLKNKKADELITDRHFVFYYGQAYLLQGNALEWMGEYEKSIQFIQHYENLNWLGNLGYIGKLEVLKFQKFAEGNRLILNVLMGKFSHLEQFINFIDKYPAEWLPCFLIIVIAANEHQINIDEVIKHYAEELKQILNDYSNMNYGHYQEPFSSQRATKLCYQLAIYYYRENKIEDGLTWLLQALRYSTRSNDQAIALQCVAYFEQFRKFTIPTSMLLEYELIMKGVIEDA